jgi:hypothetical protein
VHQPATPRRMISLLVSLGLGAGILTASLPASASTLGTVVAWGDDSSGQTDVPAGLTDATATAGGLLHSLALKADGTVMAWGDNSYGQADVPDGLSNVTAIAGGVYYNLALTSDGAAVAWGDNTYGQADVPAGLSNVTAIAAGGFHGLALTSDGTVAAWGDNSYGQRTVPAGLSNVTAIAGGFFHSLALTSDGTVVAWGDDASGQSSVPAGLTGVVAIAGGVGHSLALTSDGTVEAWGDNTYGQTDVPDGLSNVIAIAAGFSHSLALTSDGTVVAWGDDSAGQSTVPVGLSNVAAIGAGAYHSLAIMSLADVTDPTLDPEVTPNPVLLNGTATASANASDDSGIASQSCDQVDTSALGSFTVSCTATDNAGNTAEGTASYTVTANVIKLSPSKTQFKAGSTVPVKFQLLGAGGALIPTAMAQQLSDACAATATLDDLPPVCAVYDVSKGFFQANVKSSSSWAVGSVVPITITVKVDGTTVVTCTTSITITR